MPQSLDYGRGGRLKIQVQPDTRPFPQDEQAGNQMNKHKGTKRKLSNHVTQNRKFSSCKCK